MEAFLANVCNSAWNEHQDRGRSWADAISEATTRHPEHEANIRAYYERWPEMLSGSMDETVAVLEELRNCDVRLLALTNWSDETFHIAEKLFPFIEYFEGIIVSGRERLMKPDPAIFQLLIDRYRLNPHSTVFIDDSMRNVEAAGRLGINALHFTHADGLRADLASLGVIG